MSGFEVIEGGLWGAPEARTPDVERKKTAIVSDMLKERKKQQANCGDKHKEI